MEFSDTQFNSLYYIIAANCQSYTIPHCTSVLSACSDGIVSVPSVAFSSVCKSGGRRFGSVIVVSLDVCFTSQHLLMSLRATFGNVYYSFIFTHEHSSCRYEPIFYLFYFSSLWLHGEARCCFFKINIDYNVITNVFFCHHMRQLKTCNLFALLTL